MLKTATTFLIAAASSALLAACATPPSDMADATPDPRQGEEVNNICFTQQIRNWRELDRNSVIVEARVREEYKLDLIGTCNPQDAFMSLGLVSRGGSSCLSSGDKIVTDARYNDGSCSIRRIYKWNKDAPMPATAS